jgi:hypothetical protein
MQQQHEWLNIKGSNDKVQSLYCSMHSLSIHMNRQSLVHYVGQIKMLDSLTLWYSMKYIFTIEVYFHHCM